jgi:FkbM family methyltransferase
MNIDIFSEFHRAQEPADEEIFEWIALLESVVDACDHYTMLELGAGYGRWTARAAQALKAKYPGMPARFIAVEAEPTHFRELSRHLYRYGVDLKSCTLINAPVSGQREPVHFTIGHPDEWYGQAIIPSADYGFGNWPEAKVVTMEAITIPDLINDLDYIDLIDMDIQGAELPCIEHSINGLGAKVRRLFVATHSDEIHESVYRLLQQAGWHCEANYPLQRTHQTEFGTITFGDGVQYWTNPALHPAEGPADDVQGLTVHKSLSDHDLSRAHTQRNRPYR